MPATKRCAACGEVKDLIYFHRSKKQIHSYCKVCDVIRKKVQRAADREWMNDIKRSLKCVQCGEDHIAVLDFHHSDPTTKELEISRLLSMGYSRKRVLKEMERCIVLCSNCHRILHYGEVNPCRQ